MDELYHWPGETNHADIATKGKATVEDVSETSDWQLSPEETMYPRETWPASRAFIRSVPEEELRVKIFHIKGITKDGYCTKPEATFRLSLLRMVKDIMGRYEDFDKIKRIVARLLQAKVQAQASGLPSENHPLSLKT